MKKRLMLANSLIIVAGFVVAFLFAVVLVQQQYRYAFGQRLDATLAVLAAQTGDMRDDPQRLAAETGARLEAVGQSIRITVLDRSGGVLGDSEAPGLMDNHLNRPEIQQALREGRGTDIRKSESVDVGMFYDAVLVDDTFFVRAAMPTSDLDNILGGLRRVVLASMAVGIVLVCLCTWWLLSRAAKPVLRLTRAARALAAGDFSTRAGGSYRDEFVELATAFNSMADNTEAAVALLHAKQDQLEGVLQGMETGVVAVDASRHLLFLNARAQEFLSCPGLAEGGTLDGSLLANMVAGTMRDAAEAGEATLKAAEATGEQRFTVYAAPLPGKDGGALAVLTDVTRMNRLEQLRSEFVANVTHELKTPLTSIRGSIELLKSADRDEETRRYFYDILDIEAERLQSLIDDMLVLSQIEGSREDAAAVKCDLRESLQSLLARLGPAAEKLGVALELDAEEALLVNCTGTRLQQLFGNLVENSVKYNNPGGKVTVTVRNSRQMAVVRVRDTGIGIAEEHLPRLFERFYRVDSSRSREIGGTGLGLSIVKHLALLYGGDVSVESTPGKGTAVTVRLPLARGL